MIDLLQTIRIFIRFQWNDGVIVIHCIRLKLIDFLNSTRFWFRNVWIFTHIFFGSRQRKRPSAGGGSTFLFRYLLRLFLFFRIFFFGRKHFYRFCTVASHTNIALLGSLSGHLNSTRFTLFLSFPTMKKKLELKNKTKKKRTCQEKEETGIPGGPRPGGYQHST